MKKTIVGTALLLALSFCLSGCNPSNTNTPSESGSEIPPPSITTPSSSVAADPPPEPELTPDSSSNNSNASPYAFPNWNADFITVGVHRFIPLNRYVYYLSESGNSFRLINELSAEFANDNFRMWLEPTDIVSMPASYIKISNANGTDERPFSVIDTAVPHIEQINGETMLMWELARVLWDYLNIADSYNTFDSFYDDRATFFTARYQSRLLAHQAAQAAHSILPQSNMEIDGYPRQWFSQQDTRIQLSEFNAAIEAKGSNFIHTGAGLSWSNGYLTVRINQRNGGWGIVITDDSGAVVEAYDDTGWYRVYPDDNSLSGKLAVGLWWTLTVCETFTTMEPVLAEAAEQAESIDVDRARRALERARQRLAEPKPEMDVLRAQIAMHRALNRLNVAGR